MPTLKTRLIAGTKPKRAAITVVGAGDKLKPAVVIRNHRPVVINEINNQVANHIRLSYFCFHLFSPFILVKSQKSKVKIETREERNRFAMALK
jgi:hypothetical protein